MGNVEAQLTNTIVMVRPNYFGFNEQTGVDNTFQHKTAKPEKDTRDSAMREFERMVDVLDSNGLRVLTLDSPLGPNGESTPDAVFPNNWFSTHPNTLVLYPMKTENRRLERQPEVLRNALLGINVVYPQTLDLTSDEDKGLILEGTGSLVLDRRNRIAYALGSQRTNEDELGRWSEEMSYESVFFHAVDLGGRPVYHTNVVMSVGEHFAVVCTEAIRDEAERRRVVESLTANHKAVIEITLDQMYNMCGNILQTQNFAGDKMIVMSERARKAFNSWQMQVLERNGEVIPVEIDTIETVGGGSARCMMAEVFV